jgi:hypothetical protein
LTAASDPVSATPVLEPAADVSVADWIAERLHPPLGTVGYVVPHGFAAYARVLHPVEAGAAGPPMTWEQVCRITGRHAHALMQWNAITGSPAVTDSAGEWRGGDPRPGSLAPSALVALIDVLAPAAVGQDCFHALWEGWGWVDARASMHLPHRAYLLFRGPLPAALDMGWRPSADQFWPQSPSLIWPADRSWCVSTEVDFDSTLVGGPADLIEAVLAAPTLEAWPVEPDDDLTMYADVRNR